MYCIEWKEDAVLPRERLLSRGAENLSNQELLAIILRTGSKKENVLTVANRILDKIDSLVDFEQLSTQELQQLAGIGPVKSIEIKAMIEFAKRILGAECERSPQILSSERIARKMMLDLGHKKQEHLVALYLDTQNRIIKEKTVFIGTVRRSLAEPREILHYACTSMATSIIIVHNHPSGQVQPSQSDIEFTQKIKRSCEDLGIILLDHIIVGRHDYYSFREEGDLPYK